jgi:hypothetical protein
MPLAVALQSLQTTGIRAPLGYTQQRSRLFDLSDATDKLSQTRWIALATERS